MNNKTLGRLRADLLARNLTVKQMTAIADDLGVGVHGRLVHKKDGLADALLDTIGRPFDRVARDGLHRQAVTVYAHDAGRARYNRRWTEIRFDGKIIRREHKKVMLAATMKPASRLDILMGARSVGAL